MNIILINHYAGSPNLGMEYRPYYLARHWVQMGHSVSIIAASQSHVRFTQPIINKAIEEDQINGIIYYWIKTPPYEGNSTGRIINMISFIWRLFLKANFIAKRIKPDVVIASSTYPLDIYPAKRIARKGKAKLIFEVHDLWPLSPIELGGYSKWHPFIMVMQWAENFAYKHSFQIVSILPKALDHMKAHGLMPDKFNYIPNGIEFEDWKIIKSIPISHRKIIDLLKEKKSKIIAYTGSIGLANALDCLVDAAKILENENLSFLIIGKGSEHQMLVEKVKNLNLDNVYFLDPVPKDTIPSLLSEVDILYIGLKRQPVFRFGISSNKLIDYMMAGKPVIQAIDAGNNLVRESGCGISVEPENPKAIAAAIRKIVCLSEKEKTKMGRKGKQYVMENHDNVILAKKFLEIFDR